MTTEEQEEVKITELPDAGDLQDGDKLHVVRGGVSKRVVAKGSGGVDASEDRLVPTGGSEGQVLKRDADGNLVWEDDETGTAGSGEDNVNADWNATSGDAEILNKPTIPDAVDEDRLIPTGGSTGQVVKKTDDGVEWGDDETGTAGSGEENVNADWDATSGDAQILNKPDIPGSQDIMAASHTTLVALHQGNTENLTPNNQDRIYGTTTNFASGAWWRDNEILHGWIQVEGSDLGGDLPISQNFFLLTVKDTHGDIHQFAYTETEAFHFERRFLFNADPGDFTAVHEGLSGTSTPASTLGKDGSTYIKTGGTTPQIYLKDSGSWTLQQTYTAAEKNKLQAIESGAQVNVQSDWSLNSGAGSILNKPTIPASYAPTNAEQNVKSDWNATTGDAEILNKPTIPSGDRLVPTGGSDGQVVKKTATGVEWGDDEVGTAGSGEANVQADWDETDDQSDAYIANKPTIPTSYAPTNAEQNVQSDWNATSGDALILNKPTIPSGTRLVPTGGSTGQVVKKTATGVEWGDDATGDGVVGTALARETLIESESTSGTLTGLSADVVTAFPTGYNLSRALTEDDDNKLMVVGISSGADSTDRNAPWAWNSFYASEFRNRAATASGTEFDNLADDAFAVPFWCALNESSWSRLVLTKIGDQQFGGTSSTGTNFISGVKVYLQPVSGVKGDTGDAGADGNPADILTNSTLTGDGTSGNAMGVANPFTDDDETKLDGIEAGAEVNVQSDWDATSGDALILNKPTIPDTSNLLSSVATDSTLMGDGAGTDLSVSNPFTHGDEQKLDGIEANATADQTGTEIVGLIEGLTGDDRLNYQNLRNKPEGTDSELDRETLVDVELTSGDLMSLGASGTMTQFPSAFDLSRALTEDDDNKQLVIRWRVGQAANDYNGAWVTKTLYADYFRTAAVASGAGYNNIPANAFNVSGFSATGGASYRRIALLKFGDTQFGGVSLNSSSNYIAGLKVYLQPVSGVQGPAGPTGPAGTSPSAIDADYVEDEFRLLNTAALEDGGVAWTGTYKEATLTRGGRGMERSEFNGATAGSTDTDTQPLNIQDLTGRSSDPTNSYVSAIFWHSDEMNLAIGSDGGSSLASHFHSDLRVALVINGNKLWDAAMSDATTSGQGGGDTRFIWDRGSDPFPTATGREFRLLFYRASSSKTLKSLFNHQDLSGDEIVGLVEGETGSNRLDATKLKNTDKLLQQTQWEAEVAHDATVKKRGWSEAAHEVLVTAANLGGGTNYVGYDSAEWTLLTGQGGAVTQATIDLDEISTRTTGTTTVRAFVYQNDETSFLLGLSTHGLQDELYDDLRVAVKVNQSVKGDWILKDVSIEHEGTSRETYVLPDVRDHILANDTVHVYFYRGDHEQTYRIDAEPQDHRHLLVKRGELVLWRYPGSSTAANIGLPTVTENHDPDTFFDQNWGGSWYLAKDLSTSGSGAPISATRGWRLQPETGDIVVEGNWIVRSVSDVEVRAP